MAGEINFGAVNPNAFFEGAANMNGMLQRLAKRRAGKALAKGNFDEGKGILQSEGMLPEADELQQNQDLHAGRLQTLSHNDRQEHAQMILDVATSLDNIRQSQGDAAVLPAFDHLAPLFKQKGATDQEIQQYRQLLQQNPQAFLNGIIDHTKNYQAIQTQGGGVVVWDKRTGKFVQKYQPPQYRTVGKGQELVELPGDEQDPNAPQQLPGMSQQFDPNNSVEGLGGYTGVEAPPQDPNRYPMDEQHPGGMAGPSAVAPASPTGPVNLSVNPSAVKQVESGGDPNAVSPVGARGTMQTMPGTLRDPGYGVRPAQNDTPQEMERVGQDYLGALQQHYGNPISALIAYNWGPKNYEQWVAQGADMSKLPRETQQYIMKVAHAQTGLRPAAATGQPTPSAPAPQAGRPAQPQGGARVVARGQPEDTWRNMSPDELKTRGYSSGAVVQINDANGQERLVQRAPTTGGAGSGKLAPQDNIFLTKLRTEAGQLKNMATLMNEFVNLNKKNDTGGFYAVPGVSSIAAPWNPELSRMNSITDQITPAMRNGLPGAASDRDVSMFRGATVGVDKPYQTNLAIARAGKAFSDRQTDYISFMEAYAKEHGNLLGAQEQWSAYADTNPLFDDKGGMPVPRKNNVPWRKAFPDLNPNASSANSRPSGGWEYLGTEK